MDEDVLKLLKEKKYFREGETSWEDLSKRVSTAIASVETDPEMQEQVQADVYKAMTNFDFIFSTPTLLNAEKGKDGQLSSCFILSIKDSIESISTCDAEYSKIFQKNGGAGADMSALRPAKSPVNTSKGYAGGVETFLYKFDQTAEIMTKFNPSRKGAIKKDLQVWHPDIFNFIHAKDDTSKLQRMNISVSLTDDFMEAVQNDLDWSLEFPNFEDNKEIYDEQWDGDLQAWKIKGLPTITYKTLKARELLREIATSAWKTGEPGLNFRDAMKLSNKNSHISTLIGSNPCMEFTNIPYSACNLASINLKNYVRKDGTFDFERLEGDMPKYVRWMDNMITLNKLPLAKIEQITKGIRPIGIGVMGFADALILLGIKYNSKKGRDFAEKLTQFIYKQALKASTELAVERGVYPLWEGSDWERAGQRVRNSNLISVAPTGTISFIAIVSGGIEPVFALAYTRRTYEGTLYYVINKEFKQKLDELGIYSEELMQKVIDNHGSCQGISEIPKNVQNIFVTAHDIPPSEHVAMLGAIQKHVDLSVSKTINFSGNASVEDIEKVIIEAWKVGCKGITVYRDGSRDNQTLAVKRVENKPESTGLSRGVVVPAPEECDGKSKKIISGCGNIYLNVDYDENGNVVQTFINKGSKGTCKSNQEAVSRLMSLCLRGGISVEDVIDQLLSVDICPSYASARTKGVCVSKGSSCPSAIAYKLKDIVNELQVKGASKSEIVKAVEDEVSGYKCPECKEPIYKLEGCQVCRSCGWSRCS